MIGFNSIFGIEGDDGTSIHGDCPFDSLTIYSLRTGSEPLALVSRHCGTRPDFLIVKSHSLMVVFESDGSTTSFGFRLHWASIDSKVTGLLTHQHTQESNYLEDAEQIDDPTCAGGVTRTEGHGVVRSPGFGVDYYPKGARCRWWIEPEQNDSHQFSHFEITFYDFVIQNSVNCEKDSLSIIYRGMDGNARMAKYCGSNQPMVGEAIIFRPNDGKIEINFKSDEITEERGFQLGYMVIYTKLPTLQPVSPMIDRNCGFSSNKPPALTNYGNRMPLRIVGGQVVQPGSWPFAAELLFNGQHICGATIIGTCKLV